MKALKSIIRTALLLLGFIGSIVASLSIADPVGAKMADDSDPFGPPEILIQSLTLPGVYIAVAAAGAFLLLRRRSHDNH